MVNEQLWTMLWTVLLVAVPLGIGGFLKRDGIGSTFASGSKRRVLRRFRERVIATTHCIFARTAHKVLCCAECPKHASLKDCVVNYVLPSFKEALQELAQDPLSVDAIVIELSNPDFVSSASVFQKSVVEFLTLLCDHDPCGPSFNCMRNLANGLTSPTTWMLSFGQFTFFANVFASSPVYPPTHARHAFGEESVIYVLLQPKESFVKREIEMNDPRKQIVRANFEKHGRPYPNPQMQSIGEAAFSLLRPSEDEGQVLEWWRLVRA
eukprot:ANDGO_06331.mRNA.1 hypothetical protein PTSG_03429